MGFTPTADEHSIKVDGKGSATITDMMVELVPNPENFDNIYPQSDDDAEVSEDDQSASEPESDATKALAKERKCNDDSIMEANEEKKAAASRLAMLEIYGRSFENDRPSNLEECLSAYREERKKAFKVYKESEDRINDLEKERIKILKRQTKDTKVNMKEKAKASKERLKKLEKKQQLIQEKSTAKRRLKEERAQFWPRNVYRVTLCLDTNSELTPASSRRGSVASLVKPTSASVETCEVSLSVSYITHSAYWSPTYDLSLDSVVSAGMVIYRAQYCNTTSEIWEDTQVILSTSQTSFQGLEEPIPTMRPWHIRLSKNVSGTGDGTSGALLSNYEIESKRKGPTTVFSKPIEPRNARFGTSGVSFVHQQAAFSGQHQATQNAQRHNQLQQHYVQQQQQRIRNFQEQSAPAPLFDSSNTVNNMAGSNSAPAGQPYSDSGGDRSRREYEMQLMLLEQQNRQRLLLAQQEQGMSSGAGDYVEDLDETIVPDLPTLSTQESEWNESGYVDSKGLSLRLIL